MADIALLTDSHFGFKNGNMHLHAYFEKFYTEVFFPTIDERGITEVVHLGDCFDKRKGIDYWSLDWAKRVFFDPIRERGIKLHMIVGNHDIYYKESLKINAPVLNLAEYDNVTIYDKPVEASIGRRKVVVIPWVCEDNAEELVQVLEDSFARICLGHLELAGFMANQLYVCEHGMDPKTLDQFDTVISGHFHKRSKAGNITYMGNPYQMFWNDYGEDRGFAIMDTLSFELEYIDNPYRLFYKLLCNESVITDDVKGSYVKVIAKEQVEPAKLHQFVERLSSAGAYDIKVIQDVVSVDVDEDFESESTLDTVTTYVQAMDVADDTKQNINKIIHDLYTEVQCIS